MNVEKYGVQCETSNGRDRNYENCNAEESLTDKQLERGFSVPSFHTNRNRPFSIEENSSAMHGAAKEGNVSAIKLLIEKGCDVNSRNHDDKTPLHEASHWGREPVVKFLVENGADVLSRTKAGGLLPIHIAAARGHRTIVKYFLDNGVDVDVCNYDDKTPLFEGSRWGQDAVVGFLISKGANIFAKTKAEGWQAIHIAAAKGHGTIMKLLLDSGVGVDVKNFDDRTPLFEASYWGHDSVVRLLLGRGADPNLRTKSDGWLPMHAAAVRGHESIIKLFLDYGMDIDVLNHDNRTALFEASYWGREAVVRMLVDKGANIAASTKTEGWHPIHAAAARGHFMILGLLISGGADVNATNFDGKTPLFETCYWGRDSEARLLIAKDADIDKRTKTDGWHAIHTAAARGHSAIVGILLEKGVDANTKSCDEITPLMEAARWGHIEIVKLLIEKGADISATTKKEGGTALHAAASGGQTQVVLLLLENGGNVNVRSTDYKTPLYEAVTNGHYDTAKVLIERGANKNARTKNGETLLEAAKSTNKIDIINLFAN